MITDMTKGNPTTTILKFAFPMLIGNLFQQLYNIVDSVVVGRFIGKDALASFMLMNLFSFVIIGMCMGASIVYSYYFGEKNQSKQTTCSRQKSSFLRMRIFSSSITNFYKFFFNNDIQFFVKSNVKEDSYI